MNNPFRGRSIITRMCPTQSFLWTVAATLLVILVALGLFICIGLPAHASDHTSIRDRNGTVIGRVEKGYSGGSIERRVVEDNRGRRLFSIERRGDHTTFRGVDGSRIGRYTHDRGIDLDEELDDD